MHLWPSMRIRDSFKISYLRKLEWNLHRMHSEKKRSQQTTTNDNDNQQSLLEGNSTIQENGEKPAGSNSSKAVLICREILMVFTCCYCCFCCGACLEQDEA